MKRTAFHIFLGAIGLLLLAGIGCTFISKSVFSSSVQSDRGFLVHRVNWEGESLSLVARWYTGSRENWRAIAEANPALDPKKITIGSAIRIPSALLITRKPMPKGFLSGVIENGAFPDGAPARREAADVTKEPGPESDAKGRPKPDTTPGSEKKAGKAEPPAEKEEAPPLFGPKGYRN